MASKDCSGPLDESLVKNIHAKTLHLACVVREVGSEVARDLGLELRFVNSGSCFSERGCYTHANNDNKEIFK